MHQLVGIFHFTVLVSTNFLRIRSLSMKVAHSLIQLLVLNSTFPASFFQTQRCRNLVFFRLTDRKAAIVPPAGTHLSCIRFVEGLFLLINRLFCVLLCHQKSTGFKSQCKNVTC